MSDTREPRLPDFFADTTPLEIRRQILDYKATECMSDVERARYFGLPEGCRMRERAKIISPAKLRIGINCWIGEGAVLDAQGGLEIGANTSIGLNALIWSHDSMNLNIRGINTRENSGRIIRKPTKIGSNCFIGGPVVIMPGVTIGNQCVVAPMSVVYEDLPDRTVHKPFRDMYDFLRQKDELLAELANLRARVEALEKS